MGVVAVGDAVSFRRPARQSGIMGERPAVVGPTASPHVSREAHYTRR